MAYELLLKPVQNLHSTDVGVAKMSRARISSGANPEATCSMNSQIDVDSTWSTSASPTWRR